MKCLFETILGTENFLSVRETVLHILVDLDPYGRSKFDLLTLFVAKHGTSNIMQNHMDLVHQAFDLIRIIPHPTKILQFICQIIKSSIRLQENDNWWYDLVISNMFCDETRKMVGESILVPVFKEHKEAFSGFQNGKYLI